MLWIKTVGLIAFSSPLLLSASGQSRPAALRPDAHRAQNSTVHDRNWLKSQVRRRYGSSAVPEKAAPPSAEKKSAPGEKSAHSPAKN
jgi:hypothetical protein